MPGPPRCFERGLVAVCAPQTPPKLRFHFLADEFRSVFAIGWNVMPGVSSSTAARPSPRHARADRRSLPPAALKAPANVGADFPDRAGP